MSSNEIQLVNEKLSEILLTMNKRFDDLEGNTNKKVEEIRKEVSSVREDLERFTKRYKEQSTSKNIVISGLKGTNNKELVDEIVDICQAMNIDIRKYDVERVYRIRNKTNTNLIKVTLTSVTLKLDILRSKKSLASIELGKNIKIKEDLPFEVRRIRERLFPYLLAHKKQGHRVTFKYNKLLIEGKLVTLEELEAESGALKRQRNQESSPEDGVEERSAEKKQISTPRTPKQTWKKRQNKGEINTMEGNRIRTNILERYYPKVASKEGEGNSTEPAICRGKHSQTNTEQSQGNQTGQKADK